MHIPYGITDDEREVLDILRPEPGQFTMRALADVTLPELMRSVIVRLDKSLPTCSTPARRRNTFDAAIAARLALALLYNEQYRAYPLMQHLTHRMAVRVLTPHGDPDAE